MPEINKRQAFVIDGADVLPNPNGSAVGMLVELGEKMLAVLPGPPREMNLMFAEYVLPRIKARSGDILVRRRVIKVSGMGESAVDERFAALRVLRISIHRLVQHLKSHSLDIGSVRDHAHERLDHVTMNNS